MLPIGVAIVSVFIEDVAVSVPTCLDVLLLTIARPFSALRPGTRVVFRAAIATSNTPLSVWSGARIVKGRARTGTDESANESATDTAESATAGRFFGLGGREVGQVVEISRIVETAFRFDRANTEVFRIFIIIIILTCLSPSSSVSWCM